MLVGCSLGRVVCHARKVQYAAMTQPGCVARMGQPDDMVDWYGGTVYDEVPALY
jgi:hypothetical protein